MVRYISLCPLLLLLTAMSSCDPYTDDEYREYVVVESHLIADRELPLVLLSTTVAIDQEYSFHETGVRDATVMIHLLDGQDEITDSFEYQLRNPGIYQPEVQESHVVQPGRTYLLEADIPGHGQIHARTTVPDEFRVDNGIPESVVYGDTLNPLTITISKSSSPGRQNIYILNTIASDPAESQLTPGYRGLIDDDDDLELYRNNPSPLINEAAFQEDEDRIHIRYPWIGAVFYGENRIVINSLDRNISDFLRSQDVQLGGSTLSPGEIPNAIYHIEGGIGVFGSVSTDSITTNFVR